MDSNTKDDNLVVPIVVLEDVVEHENPPNTSCFNEEDHLEHDDVFIPDKDLSVANKQTVSINENKYSALFKKKGQPFFPKIAFSISCSLLPDNVGRSHLRERQISDPHGYSERSTNCTGESVSRLSSGRILGPISSRKPLNHYFLKRRISRHVSRCESDSETSKSFSIRSMPRRLKFVLMALALQEFFSSICLSIIVPFFPSQASNKGMSNTTIGWVFGVFALMQFILSPVIAKLLLYVSCKFLSLSGLFLSGGITMLFGATDYYKVNIENSTNVLTYTVMCFVLRIFLAVGCSAMSTVGFTMVSQEFPDNVGSIFGILETFCGLGMMVGPAIGGILFELGGFKMPFLVLGCLMILFLPIFAYVLPNQPVRPHDSNNKTLFKELICIPSVFVTLLSLFISSGLWGVLDPVMEPHLQQFNLSPSIVGLVFLMMAAFYAITAPIWGHISDHVNSTLLLLLGFLFISVALLLFGPAPFLPFPPSLLNGSLWLNIFSLILLGISVSMAQVPTFEKIIDAADQHGIEDSINLFGTVSAMWVSMDALGEFLGPSIGAMVVDRYGFPWTMTFIALICFVMFIILLILYIAEKRSSKSDVHMVELNEEYDDEENIEKPLLSGRASNIPVYT